jgi:hypothetical protein
MVRGDDRAKNIEKAIEEALILVLEHIREEGGE